MSSVGDPLPKACLYQVNTFMAVELEDEVTVQVSVKLLEGGTSITEIRAGEIDTVSPTAVKSENCIKLIALSM